MNAPGGENLLEATNQMKKFIVITSIFPPSPAIQKFAKMADWHLIVVGDKKTPGDWNYPGVTYLSLEHQSELGYEAFDVLPLNHYARKNLGYLYAMQLGAEWIADTDDDNIPYSHWQDIELAEHAALKTVVSPRFPNIYRHFTSEHIWPRGFPLDEILEPSQIVLKPPLDSRIGVWQFLADGDPDVDAIYRLTLNKPIIFEKREPVRLERGIYSPFNSQNTVWSKSAFEFMLLPAYVSFRFTDILRGYIAQRCLWAGKTFLAFGSATAYQERNPHNYLSDFQSEVPAYLNVKKIIDTLDHINDVGSPDELLMTCYQALCDEGYIAQEELTLCQAWINDLRKIYQDD
jgi:hypothetical protein